MARRTRLWGGADSGRLAGQVPEGGTTVADDLS